MNSGNPPSGPPRSFAEVAVFFTKEEWALLDPAQRVLYWEVTHENYETAVSLGLWVPEPFVDSQYHPAGKWLLQSDEESDKCAVVPFSGLWVPEPFVGSQHHLTGKWLLQSDEESDRCAVVPLSGAPNDLLPDSESMRIDEAMLLAQPIGEECQPAGTSQAEAHGDSSNERTSSAQPVGEEYQPAGTSQAQAHGDSSNERTSSGQTRSVPAVETSPERKALLEKRRQRRVGVLSDLGHQLLEQGTADAEEARQERRERRWAMDRHFELMLGIREALDKGFAAVGALTSILTSKLTSQDPVPQDKRPAASCALQGGDAWPTLAEDTPQPPTPSGNFSDPLHPVPEMQPTVLQGAPLLRSQLAAHDSNPHSHGVHSSSTIPGAGEGALLPPGTQSTPQAEQQEGFGTNRPKTGAANLERSDKTVSGKRARKVKRVLDM